LRDTAIEALLAEAKAIITRLDAAKKRRPGRRLIR
jgi:hypothetical protein